MSHPPETSMGLVLRIRVLKSLTEHVLTEQEAASLIDAWVRNREATAHAAAIQVALQIFREQYQAAMMDTGGDREAATYCGLQAIEKITPADVHKGVTHGQAEAPSAAASANSEPGGA